MIRIKPTILFVITMVLLFYGYSAAQNIAPKREFRGAWIATVLNLDWPSSPNLSVLGQMKELTALLDELQKDGVNAVIFQVRSECDAFYASSYEPWSYWLSGQQGKAPSPFYDPLEFAIEEAHKRGMELHAWFNPYRSVRTVSGSGSYTRAPNHVSVQHPDWILNFSNLKVLDPGLPMVRQYIADVVLDVVSRYDVDGVHFDDYFYPYPPDQIANQDDATFATYNRGFTNRGDWRRDNVNTLVKMVHDSIQVVKPYVKFGISPFGIWKNGVPAGIVGLDAYSTIYCDALAWLQQQTIDYLTPQLYWPFGGGQDYGKLMPWWASQTNGRHLYVGQALYRVSVWNNYSEMPSHIRADRANPNVQGSIFFRALYFGADGKGFTDSLRTDFYRYPALPPVMDWKDRIPSNLPLNLRFQPIAASGAAGLRWDVPIASSDGDTASRYVVYRFDTPNVQIGDLDDASKMVGVVDATEYLPETPTTSGQSYYYVVTALDRNNNESAPSNVLEVVPPAAPLLVLPADGAPDQTDLVSLVWRRLDTAASYHLQVSSDSSFATDLLLDASGLADTVKAVSGLLGHTTYYWRVGASNAGGAGAFSSVYRFTTGFPVAPLLIYPTDKTVDIPRDPTFTWHSIADADSYRIQISIALDFTPIGTIADVTLDKQDTTFRALAPLDASRIHFWRVSAKNALGSSVWSEIWRFKTGTTTAVIEKADVPGQYRLYQNYPNPFNPGTHIVFDLPKAGQVVLKIYDILGREVATLVDGPMTAGTHELYFDGSRLPTGIYYYWLVAKGHVLSNKMLLLK